MTHVAGYLLRYPMGVTCIPTSELGISEEELNEKIKEILSKEDGIFEDIADLLACAATWEGE